MNVNSPSKHLTRRSFLRAGTLSGGLIAAALLAACQQAPAVPTAASAPTAAPATAPASTAAPTKPTTATTPVAAAAATTSTASAGTNSRAASQSLIVAMRNIAPTIDPGIDWSFVGGSIIYWAYDSLYRNVGEDKVQTIPALADGMPQISSDGLQWTIKLKAGRTFHDGSPVTADDVVFTYDRQFQYKLAGSAVNTLTMLDSVKAVDPTTVQFNLKTPTPWLLAILGDPWANAVVNKKLVMANTTADDKYPGEKFLTTHDAGAGPYMVKSFEPRSRVEYTRYKDWPDWTPGPHLESVIYTNVQEPATQRLMLQNGQVDIAVDLTPEDANAALKTPGMTHHDFWTDECETFRFGLWDGKPYADKRVRQAMLNAFNFNAASQLTGGDKEIPCGFPPQLEAFNGCTVHYDYNLDKAKQILKDAGHTNDVSIDVHISQGGSIEQILLQMWQADLQKIGVKLNIVTNQPAEYAQIAKIQAVISPLGSVYVDPMGWLWYWTHPSPPTSIFQNPWYNPDNPTCAQCQKLIDQASTTSDTDKRSALYGQAIDILQEEAVWGRFLEPFRRIVYPAALQNYTGLYRQGVYTIPLTTLYWK